MKNFEDIGLNEKLIRAITDLGFEQPTPIQEKTIPYLLASDNDVIAMAQTGTGKTAAFGLPIIEQIDPQLKNIQSIVLCPTRELCMQITTDLQSYSKYMDDFNVVAVYGGASIDTQIRSLAKGKQMVVGTPGRVVDLIKRKKLKLANIKWLVLDEADEMLSMGFKEDLNIILDQTPKERQTLLFSATMPREVQSITKKYMKKAIEIQVGTKNSGAENVSHGYYTVNPKEKYEALKRVADVNPDIYGIVFCRTRSETKVVAEKLINDGYNADALHGDLSQGLRDQVMNRFRVRHLQILVATDVAARGLDVNDLTHIINYDLPDDNGVYIHRSGRSGRAGKKGISISLVTNKNKGRIKTLERLVNKKFEQLKIPTGKDICAKQLFNLIDKVEKVEIDTQQLDELLPVIYKKLDWMTREELIQKFVSVEFNRFLEYYGQRKDLTDISSSKGRGGRAKFSLITFSIGSKQQINPARLIGIINEQMKTDEIHIGKIEITKNLSIAEVDSSYETELMKAFENAEFEGKPIFVDVVDISSKHFDDKKSSRKKKRPYSGKRSYQSPKQDKRKNYRKKKKK